MVQNFARDRDETESLVYFSLETKTRPRLSPISGIRIRIRTPFLPAFGFGAASVPMKRRTQTHTRESMLEEWIVLLAAE